MKTRISSATISLLCMVSILSVKAQQLNTLYFMDNMPVRNALNPAFQPMNSFYLGLPVLGYTYLGIGNNSLTLKDVVYKQNGETIWFLNPAGDKDKFYKSLHSNTLLNTDLQLNLLSFGFRRGISYFTFGITEKVDGQLSLPKEMMKLLLYGTPNPENNYFDFKNLNANASAYTEAALGYSRIVNDRWTVGGKLKFLYGTANVSTSNEYLDLNAGIEAWTLKGKGSMNISSPAEVIVSDNLESIDFNEPSSVNGWLKPSGMGAGIDIGFTYKTTERLTLSAALIDLGMIRWNGNVKRVGYSVDYTFEGIAQINNLDSVNMEAFTDSLETAFKNSYTTEQATHSFTTYTSPKLNIAAEYGFRNNKISVGMLSRTMKVKRNIYEELTASVNLKPGSAFNMSFSYSLTNGKMSNAGMAMGLRTGFIHWCLSGDYFSFNNAPLPLDEGDASVSSRKLPVPYKSKGVNLALSVNLVFGNKRRDIPKDLMPDY